LSQLLHVSGCEYGFIGDILIDEETGLPYMKTRAVTNIRFFNCYNEMCYALPLIDLYSWSRETQEFYEANIHTGLNFKNLNTLFGWTIKTG
jgi:hypothetical protein